MSIETRKTLIERLRSPADKVAWDEFCDLYRPLLIHFFLGRGLSDEDAKDVSQIVLGRISRASPDFRYDPEKGRFRSWFYRIARNELNRFLSKQIRRNEIETSAELAPESPSESELESLWDEEYRNHVFQWACEQVKPQVSQNMWSAFWQTTVQNKSSQEVAENLGVKLGTVYIAKSRVISRLRDCVESIGGDANEHA